MTDMIISGRGLSKTYKTLVDEVRVFENIQVDIAAGSIVALVGKSGRGKTTLLNILSGLDRPTSGEVYYQDERIDNLSEEKLSVLRNRKVGFIFQHHFLLDDFTALDNVLIPLRLAERKIGKEEREHACELLSLLGLENRLAHFPDQLSGGERQRVAIARALVHDPMVIFADEPTGSLDKQNSQAAENLLWEMRDRFHKTFVIATHNLDLAHHCDQIIDLG